MSYAPACAMLLIIYDMFALITQLPRRRLMHIRVIDFRLSFRYYMPAYDYAQSAMRVANAQRAASLRSAFIHHVIVDSAAASSVRDTRLDLFATSRSMFTATG